MRRAWPLLFALGWGCAPAPSPPVDHTPPDPPDWQSVRAAPGGLVVSWKNPRAGDFLGTALVRYSGHTGDGAPDPSRLPMPGDSFGSGLVLSFGSLESYADTGLSNLCGTYVYQLWSVDQSHHWSVGPAEVDVDPAADGAAMSSPTHLRAEQDGGDVQLSWENPPDATLAAVRLTRQWSRAPAGPDDGVAVYSGAGQSAAEPAAGLTSGTSYYAAFGCNACGFCGVPEVVTLVPSLDGGVDLDGGSELRPSALTAQLSADGGAVELSWTNPPPSTGFDGVLLVRAVNQEPLGPGDPAGRRVFFGLASQASEPVGDVLPDAPGAPRTWHYRAYGCRGSSCEVGGAGASFTLTLDQALEAGGYTLIWRHATATVCGDDTSLGNAATTSAPGWWKSCDTNCPGGIGTGTATARQLDGVNSAAEGAAIHAHFLARRLPVERMLSSEFCRATGTAALYGLGPPTQTVRELTYFVYDEPARCAHTRALLDQLPDAGQNTAMVSHAGFACSTLDSLAWSEAAVYKPTGSCPSARACQSSSDCLPGEACQPSLSRCYAPADCAPQLVARMPWPAWSTLP